MSSPKDLLLQNREQVQKIIQNVGTTRMRGVLEGAERDLIKKLKKTSRGTFTSEQARVALVQVRAALKDIKDGIVSTAKRGAEEAAEVAAEGTIDYLHRTEEQFKGIGQPLALDEAAMYERAVNGAQSSILRRLASSGEPVAGAEDVPHAAKVGILDRYGLNTIGYFEDVFQRGVLAKKSSEEMRAEIVEKSPFLQQAPAHWASRIVRTELAGAANKANWESVREADDQLGDMVKIVSGVFDARTASDSYASHGQIRRPDEAFETWFGLMQHPPDRPNDRSLVVPHRISWPIPDYLKWRSQTEIAARWALEKRKGPIPPRPLMTTVPLSQFGK